MDGEISGPYNTSLHLLW